LTKSLFYEIKKDQFYEFYWALDESIERDMLIRSAVFSIWSYPVQCIISMLSDRLLENALEYHEKLVRAFFLRR